MLSGLGTCLTVQYKLIIKQTIHPKNPANLLQDIDFSEENTSPKNLINIRVYNFIDSLYKI